MSKKIHIPNNCKRGLTTHILNEKSKKNSTERKIKEGLNEKIKYNFYINQ